MAPAYIRARFEEACKHPVLYHGHKHLAAVHLGLVRGYASPLERQRTLQHKVQVRLPKPLTRKAVLTTSSLQQTLQLLRRLMDNLDEQRIELALLAIIMLLREDPETIASDKLMKYPLPFVPHMPHACWVSAFGKANVVKEHLQAIVALVNRAGRLPNLSLDLDRELRMADLITASATGSKPCFPFPAHSNNPTLSDLQAIGLCDATGQAYGFIPLVTPEASLVLRQLGILDRLMAIYKHQHFGDPQYFTLIRARNIAQHSLLSLPAWNDLSATEKRRIDRFEYECSRLTARLYATAVLFPIPSSSGWHIALLSDIYDFLIDSTYPKHLTGTPLDIWSAYICGIASYRTAFRTFYVQILRRQLQKANLRSRIEVRPVFEAFIWSDTACEHGAAVLWDELRIEDAP